MQAKQPHIGIRVPVATVLDDKLADETSRLFLAMAEGIKQPLMHIAHSAELAGASAVAESAAPAGGALGSLADIRRTADMSLQLLDSYALSLRLSLQPTSRLELEPVSVSSVLHDTAHELQHAAAQYGVRLQLNVKGRYEPVLANRQALQAALVSLGYGLIEALPAAAGVGSGQQLRLQLASHRTKQGIVAGVYGQLEGLTPQTFRQARGLHGRVRQPFVAGLPGSGAGIFVADTILAAMASRLRVGRYQKLSGFAVTLPASEQLQLV